MTLQTANSKAYYITPVLFALMLKPPAVIQSHKVKIFFSLSLWYGEVEQIKDDILVDDKKVQSSAQKIICRLES